METRNWYAWVNLMPFKPDAFHVNGEIFVANPGVQAELYITEPQGFNPAILMLNLHLMQRPGIWPQVTTWVPCRYDRVLSQYNPKYTEVQIFLDNVPIALMKINELHSRDLIISGLGEDIVNQTGIEA